MKLFILLLSVLCASFSADAQKNMKNPVIVHMALGDSDEGMKEMKSLSKIDFISGNIYFSGAGFSHTIGASIHGSPAGVLKTYFDRMMPGTIISFEDCAYITKDKKSRIRITRTFHVQ